MKYKLFPSSAFPHMPNLCKPLKKTDGAVGYDLAAREQVVIPAGKVKRVPLGVAMEVPANMEVQIRPRSGLSSEGIMGVFGTVDSDYRDEVKAIVLNTTDEDFTIEPGDRVAQMVFALKCDVAFWQLVEDLAPTDRKGGFGSTGLNDLNSGTDS